MLVSESFARRHGLEKASVAILGQAITTDRPSTFESGDMRRVVGFDVSREAGQKVYEQAAIGPDDTS